MYSVTSQYVGSAADTSSYEEVQGFGSQQVEQSSEYYEGAESNVYSTASEAYAQGDTYSSEQSDTYSSAAAQGETYSADTAAAETIGNGMDYGSKRCFKRLEIETSSR